jgi:hypothetical protein
MLITFYIKLTTFEVNRSIFTFIDMIHLLSMEIKIERVQWRMFLICPYRLCFRVLMSSYSHAGCVRANKSHSTIRRTCSATKSLPTETTTLRSPSLTLQGNLLANFLHSSMAPITSRGEAQYIPLVNPRFFFLLDFRTLMIPLIFYPFAFLQILENFKIWSFGCASGDSTTWLLSLKQQTNDYLIVCFNCWFIEFRSLIASL